MGRGPRETEPGGIYHVWSRGSDRNRIVVDRVDCTTWVSHLDATAVRSEWLLFAWMLLTNHFHLLVQIGEAGLSSGMQRLNGGFSRMFNLRHGRDAHLFRNRFSYRQMESDEDLLSTCRYIERNAIEAGLCRSPEEYPWSSYRAIVDLEPPLMALARSELLELFGHPERVAVQRYRAFIVGDD